MRKFLSLAVVMVVAAGLVSAQQAGSQMPAYSSEQVLNFASINPGPLAPNSQVAVYGLNLAWGERYITEQDVVGDLLPTMLTNTGVTVLVNGVAAPVLSVGPNRVVFLMSPFVRPGDATVRVVHSGRAGPAVKVKIAEYAPEFFQYEQGIILARHSETWSWVTPEDPAKPGETVWLYATGLGDTHPAQIYRRLPLEAAEIVRRKDFELLLNGEPLPPESITYAGVMPRFPGYYEIRVKLPESLPDNPEFQMRILDWKSREKTLLPLANPPADENPPQPETPPEGSNP